VVVVVASKKEGGWWELLNHTEGDTSAKSERSDDRK
jgi:hypothetical protein